MHFSAADVGKYLAWESLIEALRCMFIAPVHSPLRHHHTLPVPGQADATLLLMPAWLEGEYFGVKQVSVFPSNNALGLPGLNSQYTLSCGRTGQTLATLDGNELTARRTAAASALASGYLSRGDSSRLLMVGSGRMARFLIPAHTSVRPITEITVWDRKPAHAQRLVDELQQQYQAQTNIRIQACPVDQLAQAAQQADIISCATMATEPLVLGAWLSPGCHLDLVGSFTPQMREVDNQAIQRAALFVDTRRGALNESGEIMRPIQEGIISADALIAELAELCAEKHPGRSALKHPTEAITLFKSVGDSLEDLAAAILAYQQQRKETSA